MATVNADITLKYQTTKDGDVEETSFASGDEIEVVSSWGKHHLIKDDDGHYYNIPKEKVDE